MANSRRATLESGDGRLATILAVLGSLAFLIPGSVQAQKGERPTVKADPGSVVRWAVPGTRRCAMGGKSYAAIEEACYYPIDLQQKPGLLEIARWGDGPADLAMVSVNADPYPTQEIDLGDIPQANPSPEDMKRIQHDHAVLAKVWGRKGPAQFTLPLGGPVSPLPAGTDFGAKRVFNGKGADQPHTGADYAVAAGTPILAVADGTVAAAEDMFHPGNAVFIDHGDGLISMYFHLTEIKATVGQAIKKGETVGTCGSTGRSTGPHLHFGFRWRRARIDPKYLLEDPAKMPSVQ